MADYIIGIDLGTTNSVVAFTEAKVEKGQKPTIHVMEIPQLTAPGTVEKRNVLPSFIYIPGEHDVAEGSLDLPWEADVRRVVGEFARERGSEIPQRLVASSKSWLCHTQVDRNKPILPWEAPDEVEKLSPVDAASTILHHIREAWNETMAADDTSLAIENQEILLTVPASFDAVARELTVKGAEKAGLKNITLLEEPQAAFYAWIEATGDDWREAIEEGDLILVCDVGGGTSDFSLIRVAERQGNLELERIAVGDHLLVGGDNMDLALAYAVSQEISKKKRLDAWQMRSLWHACRKAKETLLSEEEAEDYTVTLLGRGSKLIGGTKKAKVTRETVSQVILDGFFPPCPPDALPTAPPQVGIREIGLSYESDPAITRHIAHFITRQTGDGGSTLPSAILFNGGVMKAASVRQRIMEVVSSWGEKEESVREIQTNDYDLTVARGAVYYGLARMGDGIRIRSGLNQAYYIGVAASLPAVPGMPVPIKALCIAPFGMEEGSSATIPDQEFFLVVGEPVKFDFLGSTVRLDDPVGWIVDDWEEEIEPITTLETTLDGQLGTSLPVYLESRVTEIGTLEIWCVSRDDEEHRWKLEFNVREQD